MKNVLTLLTATMMTGICISSIGFSADDVAPLKEFSIKTHEIHKDVPGSDLTDWALLLDFQIKGNKVLGFSSREQLLKFSDLLLAKAGRGQAAAISKLIADRVEQHVDFAKQNLVIVRMHTGGPPYETFKHEIRDRRLRFWLEKPENPKNVSGLALKTFWHMYATPKNLKVATTNEAASKALEP